MDLETMLNKMPFFLVKVLVLYVFSLLTIKEGHV